MDHKILFVTVTLLGFSCTVKTNPTTATTPTPKPAYELQDAQPSSYVPHQTYPFADTYGTPYEGYLYPIPRYPSNKANQEGDTSGDTSSLVPTARSALQITLKVLAKIGLFLIGGITFLLIGGLFTTAVCTLTPLCTISFMSIGGINKATVRSFMTPDRISSAAALIQDAIGKYQRLQRDTGN